MSGRAVTAPGGNTIWGRFGVFVMLVLLEESIINEDAGTVKDLARSLKAGGTSFGFEIITEVACVIEQGVFNGMPLAELKQDVDQLSRRCFQVRAPHEMIPAGTDSGSG